jgi:uncharacterized membrane protein YgcG
MWRSAPLIVLWIALIVVMAVPGGAAAVAPEIKDDAKFFSPEAVKKANADIREIMRRYGRDLLIETFPSAPADRLAKVKEMSSEDRAKFFHTWAVERAEAAVVNGVYILVCKDPAHVRVEITPKARSVFNERAYDKLTEILLNDFRAKRFDEGLEAAVRFVRQRWEEDAAK